MSDDNKSIKNNKLNKFFGFVLNALIFILVAGSTFYAFEVLTGDRSLLESEDKKAEDINSSSNNIEDIMNQVNDIFSGRVSSGNSTSTVSTNQKEDGMAADISEVVENVMPAIVAIQCTSTSNVTDFFGRNYSKESVGSGSGIIIGQNENEVLIVTNNHVVEDSRSVSVMLSDGTKCDAAVKGTDAGSDLAVIAISINKLSDKTLSNIKIAALGDSKQLRVGEMSIAIGNALGYGQSVTVGNISALNREVAAVDYSMNLIQTDAAINPGNSGGALINVKGEVIGINSVKYAAEDVEGIGYAIPISDAIPIIKELMNMESISENEQAYLGVIAKDVTAEFNIRYGMPIGVYVLDVEKNSPAYEAGIKKGDIITSISGELVTNGEDLKAVLSEYRKSENANIKVMRVTNGSYGEKELTVKFGNTVGDVKK